MILDPGFDLTLRPMKYPVFYEQYKAAIKNTWTVEEVDFDLHALVKGTVRLVQPIAEQKGLSLLVSIMSDVPRALRGDAHHLRQVLINLVTNAVKFTSQGSVVVHLSSVANFGARRAFEAAFELEKAARSGERAGSTRLYSALEAEIEALRPELLNLGTGKT